jgi:hypothetical protein
MNSLFPLIIVAVVALIAIGMYVNYKQRQAFLAWLGSRGYALRQGRDFSMAERFPNLTCLRHGENRYAEDVFDGTIKERAFFGYNYHYETHTTDKDGNQQTQHHHFSVVTLSSEIYLKQLSIRPEGIFDKVGAFFGHEDINFESAEFSRKFYVTSPDRKWAYDILHARMMECLLQKPRFSILLDGQYIHAYGGSRFNLQQWDEAFDVVTCILDGIPEYVRQQSQVAAPQTA